MKSRGFTLIELLIVVAIIAILAAIAVPNFLEAQTRATISRTRADLRTVATGLATYRIDNNAYPIDGAKSPDDQAYWYVPGGPGATYKAAGLTSPISYLSTAKLVDPFRKAVDAAASRTADAPDGNNFENIDYCRYRYTSFPYTYSANASAKANYMKVYGTYRVWASGPDKTAGPSYTVPSAGNITGAYLPYDATNGTVSRGDILRSEMHAEQPLIM